MKKNNQEVAIEIKNLTKYYHLRFERPSLVKNIVSRKRKEEFCALHNLNLEIKKGDKIGIIGPNGSGKTTLLKMIAGIASPTKGTVKTKGRLVSLIDVSAGFYPELTGRENVILNGMLVGMTRDEVMSKYDNIVAFADIGSFIDSPIYSYSEGMKLRLGFSVAVATDPDILVLDEGIAAGDENFQRKSQKMIQEMYDNKRTILTATHWINYLRVGRCNRVLWLEKGKLVADGGVGLLDKFEEKYRKEYELVSALVPIRF